MIIADAIPCTKRIAIRVSIFFDKINAREINVYAKSPIIIKGFRPFLSDNLPKKGKKKVLESENALNIRAIYNPPAPTE